MATADAVAEAEVAGDDRFFTHEGPDPGLTYPLEVVYCDVCDNWPVEYTEFHPLHEKAKVWMQENLTDEMRDLCVNSTEGETEEQKKKRQTRGGRGVIKTKKKQEKLQKITLSRAPRGKKKSVTVIAGLATYDIDLKTASKFFAGKFSCGSSVVGEDSIVIQGDVKDDLFDMLSEKWPQIDPDTIEDLGDLKR